MKEVIAALNVRRKSAARELKTLDGLLARIGRVARVGGRRNTGKGSRARKLAGAKAAATKRRNKAKAEAESAATDKKSKPVDRTVKTKTKKVDPEVQAKLDRAAKLRNKRNKKFPAAEAGTGG